MVIKPEPNELSLLSVHLCLNVGMFGCDNHLVISNVSLRPLLGNMPGAAKMKEALVSYSMETVYGGHWKTSLNTELFLTAWAEIFRRGLHKRHDWTVKLDADTAFLAQRLYPIVQRVGKSKSVYLNSCPWCVIKLIGPIEVISRAAAERLETSLSLCRSSVAQDDCSEDEYLERCFRVLGVAAEGPQRELLLPFWHVRNGNVEKCRDAWAAFHPFKDAAEMVRCLEVNAR